MNLSQLRSRCKPHLWFQLYWVVYLVGAHPHARRARSCRATAPAATRGAVRRPEKCPPPR